MHGCHVEGRRGSVAEGPQSSFPSGGRTCGLPDGCPRGEVLLSPDQNGRVGFRGSRKRPPLIGPLDASSQAGISRQQELGYLLETHQALRRLSAPHTTSEA
jgi:hypothetical protein